jgi:hypothetical protein
VIPVEKVHDLTVGSSPDGDHPPHIAAASGLVRHNGRVFVVADDELSLLVVDEKDLGPGYFMPILPGHLPDDREARKKTKADIESIAFLPPAEGLEHGALFALGSGSSDKRNRGALIPLDAEGKPTSDHRDVDLKPLFDDLKKDIDALNVEGAEVVDGTLWLMQRGNESGDNALINLALDKAMRELVHDHRLSAESLRNVDHVDLGQHRGEKLCFSDASALPDGRIVFAASTEAGDDAVADGTTYGSSLGIIERDGSLGSVEPIDWVVKVEGIDARLVEDSKIEVLLVTDADDPDTPSPLLKAFLPHGAS